MAIDRSRINAAAECKCTYAQVGKVSITNSTPAGLTWATGTEYTIVKIPTGALVKGVYCVVTRAFTGTSPTVTVTVGGVTTTSAASISTAGAIALDTDNMNTYYVTGGDVVITLGGTGITAGDLMVVVDYIATNAGDGTFAY